MRAAAKLGGVSATAWSDLEAGKSPPSTATQRAVALALQWPVNWLNQIEGSGYVTQQPVDDPLAALRAQVEALRVEVAALQRDVGLLGGEAVRAARRAKRAAP